MAALTCGVLATSSKENEHRLPIHPQHVARIDADLRERIVLEHGYGHEFGVEREHLEPLVAGMRTREEIIATCDVILLPKPTLADLQELRDGQVLWGWPHCVQNPDITQAAIDRRLTLIAWEAMNHLNADGSFLVHVFHANNEMAGYCSVLHALTLMGITGHYGHRMSATVIGFGNTARGAITALQGLGVTDVKVLTQRPVAAVASPIPSTVLGHLERDPDDPSHTLTIRSTGPVPTAEFLGEQDIIVNCMFQDTDAPVMLVDQSDLHQLRPGTLIVDVSCDEGMGFSFARPTTFADPMLTVGDGVHYYGVDHSPSFLWNSATWEISRAVVPFLRTVMGGPRAWEADAVIDAAIEIRDGQVRNEKILTFQGRAPEHPHPFLAPPRERVEDA